MSGKTAERETLAQTPAPPALGSWRPLMDLLRELQEGVPPDAYALLVEGRTCDELASFAGNISLANLSVLYQNFAQWASQPERMWARLATGGVQTERFIALMMALFADGRTGVSGAAAACYIAALRCGGATGAGILHPIAVFELLKVVRTELCAPEPEGQKADKRANKASRRVGAKSVAAAPTERTRRAQRSTAQPISYLNEDELELGSGRVHDDEEEEEEHGHAATGEDGRLLRELAALLESVPLRSAACIRAIDSSNRFKQ